MCHELQAVRCQASQCLDDGHTHLDAHDNATFAESRRQRIIIDIETLEQKIVLSARDRSLWKQVCTSSIRSRSEGHTRKVSCAWAVV